jgi:KDO2-lipid IV(A) lauroyltransferase
VSGIHDRLRAMLVRLVACLVRSLPPHSIPSLAWLAGTTWYLVDRRRRRRTAENLRVSFGDTLDGPARARLAREVFRSMSQVPLEVLWFGRLLGTPRQLARRCTYHGDWPTAQPAGVAWGGHLGNWELLVRAVQPRLGRMRSVARRIKDPAIQAIITGVRGGRSEVIDKHGAYRDLVRTVRDGAWVGIVGDQNAGTSGRFIPFFGLPASTYESPARLALREGVPLVVLVAIRRPGRELAFDIHSEVLREAGPRDRGPDAIEPLLARMCGVLENWARRHPEQYNFLHRRWKDRPPGEQPGPHLPRYDHHRPRPVSPPSPPSEA